MHRYTPSLPLLSVCALFLVSCQSEYQTNKKTFENWRDFRGKVEAQKKRIHDEETNYRKLLLTWNESVPNEHKVSVDDHLAQDPINRVEQWIKKRIVMEKDITYEGLIDEIEALNDKITERQLLIDRLESLRGFTEPNVVQSGDTHFELALQFLVEKHNLTPERASEITRPVALWDDLIEGFYVFFLYDNTRFYTSVEQGLAKTSPNEYKAQLDKIRREKIQRLTQLYEQEQSEYKRALDRIGKMSSELATKMGRITELEELYNSIQRNLRYVQREADSLELVSNSIYYAVITREHLKNDGLSRRIYFGLRIAPLQSAYDIIYFRARVDTRASGKIYIDNRKSRQKVYVYTEKGDLLRQGRDYTMLNLTTIELRNPTLYRQMKLLIVLS